MIPFQFCFCPEWIKMIWKFGIVPIIPLLSRAKWITIVLEWNSLPFKIKVFFPSEWAIILLLSLHWSCMKLQVQDLECSFWFIRLQYTEIVALVLGVQLIFFVCVLLSPPFNGSEVRISILLHAAWRWYCNSCSCESWWT